MTDNFCSANVRPSPEKKTRRRWIQLDILIVVLFILAWIILMAYRRADGAIPSDDPPDVLRLNALSAEWIDLKEKGYRLKAEQRRRMELMDSEVRLLTRQRTRLMDEVEAAKKRVALLEASITGVRTELEGHATALEALKPALDDAESHLDSWEKRLPRFLLESGDEGGDFPENGDARTLAETSDRLHNIVARYGKLEGINCDIHANRLMARDAEGTEREFDVLFLGLSAGFGVTRDGTLAARIRITPDGPDWDWESGPARAIRRAWASAIGEKDARFVKLPLSIEEAR